MKKTRKETNKNDKIAKTLTKIEIKMENINIKTNP